jgi:hypothetical protein
MLKKIILSLLLSGVLSGAYAQDLAIPRAAQPPKLQDY